MSKEKYYITTAIPYANADPHIGFALEIVYADAMARFERLLGKEVYFLTGTDEHGQKMYKTALEAGRPVKDFSSEKSAKFLNLADQWNISNDDFIRTTEKRHIGGAQKFWQAAEKSGDIYKKEYVGLYCVGCECFKTEKDLVDGLCPDHKTKPEVLKEENYFFRLSRYQESLEMLFSRRADFVFPESRFNEMKNILKNGLEDVSISRSKEKLPWGIPVPGDASQVMYVWFDALTNYVTALGWGEKNAKLFKKFWPADVHIIGKEINRFHSLLWPAMLMSAGVELPRQIAVHGWITADGQKMSKSLGNVINPLELTEKYPLDAARYFLLREIPFDNDGDFSYQKFIDRFNGDLANGLGNLVNRVTVMIEKYSEGKIPASNQKDAELVEYLGAQTEQYISAFSKFSFNHALEAVFSAITFCDRRISDKQPWQMFKDGKTKEVESLLYHLSESLRQIAIMLWPVMPDTAEKILSQLGLKPTRQLAKPLSELLQWGVLEPGSKIKNDGQLFPRL